MVPTVFHPYSQKTKMFGPFLPKLRQHILILLSYFETLSVGLVPVVQTLGSAIHQINDYLVIRYEGNQMCYALDGDLSSG